MKKRSHIIITMLLIIIFSFLSVAGAGAQEDVCGQGGCPEDGAKAPSSPVDIAGLGQTKSYELKGGYVAAGTGLRNRGYGKIVISGIPAGATVYKAYLYWNIIDYQQKSRHQKLIFKKTKPIVGTYIGADHAPYWVPPGLTGSAYSYRANVTKYVKGNGTYKISGVASGRTDGADPDASAEKLPLAQGASLVVIFQKSSYPKTIFKIWDGAVTLAAPPGGNTSSAFINIGGFTATNPVGPAYTTFIGADGQSLYADIPSQVNYNNIPEADWDGTDPQSGANFIGGNLWDTDTASVGKFISPGNTSVNISVSEGGDHLTWVAQVFSISKGHKDTDKDALLDGWEANGVGGINLPAMGASPYHKDIFVEHDWMDGAHLHQPSTTVLNRVRDSFAKAPVNNPDGKKGIKLHNDYGQAPYGGGNSVPHQTYITTAAGCPMWTGFDTIKTANFDTARQDIFHYVVWAHDICSTYAGTSGWSRGIPASDFIVSLGSWSSYGTTDARTGTFQHELGHNIGLTHGGNTGDHKNYKPNHVSLMNYAFQVIGVWRNGARRWDYTRMTIKKLDENALNEFKGLNGSSSLASYGTRYYCSGVAHDDNTADTNVNWNCKNGIQLSVKADINKDGAKNVLGEVHNQWKNLIYNGGSIGPGVAAPSFILQPSEFELYPCINYENVLDDQIKIR